MWYDALMSTTHTTRLVPFSVVPFRDGKGTEDIVTGRVTNCIICGGIIAEIIDPQSGVTRLVERHL